MVRSSSRTDGTMVSNDDPTPLDASELADSGLIADEQEAIDTKAQDARDTPMSQDVKQDEQRPVGLSISC